MPPPPPFNPPQPPQPPQFPPHFPPTSPPPGYVAYGGAGAYGGTYQRIGGLTKALSLRNNAIDFRNGIGTLNLGALIAIGLFAAAAGIALLVVQIIWTFRMSKNLAVLARPGQSFSPGATIAINILGGCTLGILPYFMWRELWKGSDPSGQRGDTSWKQGPVDAILHIWIALTLVNIAVSLVLGFGNALFQFRSRSNSAVARQLADQIGITAVTGLLSVATGALFLVFIRKLSARHMQATGEA
jgi:Domain of unknown function (DUF4328)